MNRLVLIGNGFDLAHNLKTKYEDFFYWYWNYRLSQIVKNPSIKTSEDILCKLESHGRETFFMTLMYDVGFVSMETSEGKEIYNKIIKNRGIDKEFSPLFDRIKNSIEIKGWVDIEYEYYSLLCLLFNQEKGNYQNLNNQLDYLRMMLIAYLKIATKHEVALINDIKEKIYQPIKQREVAVSDKKIVDESIKDTLPSNIMLLNFNYTKTPELYLTESPNVFLNYIHGSLDAPKSVIFGYGDELDEGYMKLKNSNNNECLRFVKSIRYLESDHYRKVLEFIESGPFQISIMGHSCGNSDRTLLNTLFEHRNCVSIVPYYYIKDDGTDNYLELVQNISRNFTDMKLMRDRVVNKTYSEPLVEKKEEKRKPEMRKK